MLANYLYKRLIAKMALMSTDCVKTQKIKGLSGQHYTTFIK